MFTSGINDVDDDDSNKQSQQNTAKPAYFVCQKCHKALQVSSCAVEDSTLISSFRTSVDTLPTHLVGTEYLQREHNTLDALAESFVVLPAPQRQQFIPQQQSDMKWNETAMRLTKLFEVISDKCQLDHPLCIPCAEELHRQLLQRIHRAQETHAIYAKTLEEFASDDKIRLPASPPPAAAAVVADDKALQSELERIRNERDMIAAENAQLDQQEHELDGFERRFWLEYQDFQRHQYLLEKERGALQQRVESAQADLERLRRTNVYDDVFHIYYDGHFGTINGFRLGRLPSQQVDWSEISAALGQVILLLKTLADECNFKFSEYRLMPMGSFSKIAKLSDLSTAYELYGSQDFSVGKLFWYRRFDTALVWLLECIREFGLYATNLDTNFKLKYDIDGHSIGGHSVKMQFNNDASWTKAMKYMLTNLKFLLAWTTKHKDH